MKKKGIEATINEGGKTCTTVNPFDNPVIFDVENTICGHTCSCAIMCVKDAYYKAECERQTLEIEHILACGYIPITISEWKRHPHLFNQDYIKPGQTVEIEIVNGKARVL